MILVLLDNVRSALNVGSVFRTADSFGLSEVVLCGITATPPSREIHKTALGAELSVPYRYFESSAEAIETFRNEGFVVVAVEQDERSVDLRDFKVEPNQKYVFVLGNEVEGVSSEVLALCDKVVEIEQKGVKKSLNVSVAAGVVLWRVTNQF